MSVTTKIQFECFSTDLLRESACLPGGHLLVVEGIAKDTSQDGGVLQQKHDHHETCQQTFQIMV